MKMICFIAALSIIFAFHLQAQTKDSSSTKKWEFGADGNFYLIPNNFIFLPVIYADKGVLHLEARYNYEDIHTASAWAGYNFIGGKKLEYKITPMLGGVFGYSNGLAPGLEFTLNHKHFELYSESEYFLDFINRENDFFYIWTDFTYSPKEWLWFGLSIQRTKLYQTNLDVQRGFIVGAVLKNWELSGYLYNVFFDDPFVLLTLSLNY